MNFLEIGSVIRVNDVELIVLGYHIAETDTAYQFYYMVGLFPTGYMPGREKSIGYLAVEHSYELLFRGYSDAYSEAHLQRMSRRYDSLKDMDPRVMQAIIQKAIEKMEEKHG